MTRLVQIHQLVARNLFSNALTKHKSHPAQGRTMLVLSRKEGEQLIIGDDIVLTVSRISGNRVAIGIEAPRNVRIIRGELERREVPGGTAPNTASMEDSHLAIASQAHG